MNSASREFHIVAGNRANQRLSGKVFVDQPDGKVLRLHGGPEERRFYSVKNLYGRVREYIRSALVYSMEVEEERRTAATFEELAMPLFDQLYNFAHWLTQDRSEAEDLVQETYVKALRGFSSFQPGTNFRAWIYRILRNTFLTSRTGLKASATVQLDADDGPNIPAALGTPETILMERSQQQLLQGALEELPLHFREILLLCEVEEMSYQEMAEALSIPIGTVMSRLSRARKALRENLQQKLHGS
jgi:RNA polymerase sigma-70 factor (ECF subfamily)